LTVEAYIVHRGRTPLIVEVEVFDDQRRTDRLAATQLAPAAAPAAGSREE
jgi:acyl-CoA hydrolase